MRPIINGSFQESSAAKLAVIALLEGGFADEKISCFPVQALPDHLGGSEGNQAFSTTDGTAGAELSGGGLSALSGAAVGVAVGAAIAIMSLPALGPMVGAAAIGIGAYGGSLYGVLGAESAAPENINGTRQDADAGSFGTSKIRQRRSGTLVAVVAESEALQAMARQVLISQGAGDIELTEGYLEKGEWSDFNPMHEPHN